MGFHVSLLMVAGEDRAALLSGLGLTETGAEDPYNETPFSGGAEGGQYLLWQNWHDGMFDEQDYMRLSQGLDLVTLDLSEGSMLSICRSWKGGRQLWSVHHEGGGDALGIEGSPPGDPKGLHAQALAQNTGDPGVDHVFDIPVRIFEGLGGIRYDGGTERPFMALERTAPSSAGGASRPPGRPWWKFW